jgi:hypothetical protein
MWLSWRFFLVGLRILGRQRRDLVLENLILRQQLAIWERSGQHPVFTVGIGSFGQSRREAGTRGAPISSSSNSRPSWAGIVSSGATNGTGGAGAGLPVAWHRPPDPAATHADFRGESDLAHAQDHGRTLGAGTPSQCRNGLALSRRPTPSPSWWAFLRLHASEIWSADFFTVQTLRRKPKETRPETDRVLERTTQQDALTRCVDRV